MVREYGPENKHLQQQAQVMGIYASTGYGMPCRSFILLKGQKYGCDLKMSHSGWAHQNFEAEALWREAE